VSKIIASDDKLVEEIEGRKRMRLNAEASIEVVFPRHFLFKGKQGDGYDEHDVTHIVLEPAARTQQLRLNRSVADLLRVIEVGHAHYHNDQQQPGHIILPQLAWLGNP